MADPAELMDRDGAGQVRAVPHVDMPCHEDAIGQDDFVFQPAVVRDVRPDHQQVAVANRRRRVLVERAVNRARLPNDVVIADRQPSRLLRHLRVLRQSADHGALEDLIACAQGAAPFDDDMAAELATVAQNDVGLDDREGANHDIVAQFGFRD